MIDKKKIEEAADIYMDKCIKEYEEERSGEACKTMEQLPCFGDRGDAFKAGVNWFKENLWHPMSDKPEMGAEILIQRNMEVWRKHHPGLNVNSTTVHEFDFHDDWKSYEHDDEYKRWLYIDDLLKGGIHE